MESDVSSSPTRSQQPRENDDFDERAAEFWAVYVREARSHDEASIGTWKDDMEGIIIFVRFQYEPVNNSSCAVPSGWFILGRLDCLYHREPKKPGTEPF